MSNGFQGFPVPIPDADSQRWWDALRDEVVLYQRCGSCGHAQLYFRAVCTRCWSRDLEHHPSTGGHIYSFTVVHQCAEPVLRDETPFVLAIVELDEGPRIVGRVEADAEDVSIGARASFTFRDVGPVNLLYFALDPIEAHR